MWNMVNGFTNGIRNRVLPGRRQNGIGTMTAMLIGASVGIAAWETIRRTQPMARMMPNNANAADLAEQVINQLDS
jgi:hypothetical protein